MDAGATLYAWRFPRWELFCHGDVAAGMTPAWHKEIQARAARAALRGFQGSRSRTIASRRYRALCGVRATPNRS